jgi:hypothetical protein
VGVIVIVNHGEMADSKVKESNRLLYKELWERYGVGQTGTESVYVEVMKAFDLSAKFAGVGMARKLAMDAAAFFFYQQGAIEAPILSLDADTWMDENYLEEVIRYFQKNQVAGVSIAYEHRLEEEDEKLIDAIIKYELYLRYYQLALAYTGHPHAFHCIGSAFAVRVVDYVAQGGMNKRQAGEDFYFLQKLITTDRYATLATTRVYPSARFSTRTPFGTGQTVRQIVAAGGEYLVFNFAAFRVLRSFFTSISDLYGASRERCEAYVAAQEKTLQAFLQEINGVDLMVDANTNCASLYQFKRRFFVHFNAFRVLKYLNFAHERCWSRVEVQQAVEELLQEMQFPIGTDNRSHLEFLRQL